MSNTLPVIEAKAQHLARDANLNITSASAGLIAANRIYRRFAQIAAWPELHRQTTLTTVAAQEKYSATALDTWFDIQRVEIQDDRDSDKYAVIGPANTQARWARAGYEADGFPDLYQMENSAGVNKLALRPRPDTAQASNTIRVSGQIIPTDLTASATTFCRNVLADDALALMIAADWQFKRGQAEHANHLLQRSVEIIMSLTGKEITVAEMAVKLKE